jgi:glycosyltransferase involved in cell wall biosynthesis
VNEGSPRATIGIPVYNGEKYLAEAIESGLSQTFTDFEIVIADNASTDATPEICQSFADKDDRVRYVRNPENLGASPNYRRVFELARGEYFCWMPADEAMLPEYLEKLVEVLDNEPDVVLAFPHYRIRHNSDEPKPHPASRDNDLRQATALERIRKMFRQRIVGPNWPIFGLYRRDVLAETQLLRPLIGADDYVTLEMALSGKLGQVPDELYVLRTHADAWHQQRHKQAKGLARVFGTETVWAAAWFDPTNKKMKVVFPHWRRIREFFLLFWRSDEPFGERLKMVGVLPIYVRHRWRRLSMEVAAGFFQLAMLPIKAWRERKTDAKAAS